MNVAHSLKLHSMKILFLLGLILAHSSAIAQTMALGIATQPSAALLQIAVERGLLKDEGIAASVTRYPSGKHALQEGLFTGEVDVVSAADTPVVASAFSRRDFAVVAIIFRADSLYSVIARRDAGIETPADLNGKTIAMQKASAVQYFLHLFSQRHRLRHETLKVRFLRAEELPKALLSGEVDAFAMREPYISQAAKLLGDRAVVFSEPGLFPQYELLVVTRPYLNAKPEAVKALLRALFRAHGLLEDDPETAVGLVARFLNTDVDRLLDAALGWHTDVTLDQAMLLAMEFEAQWMIDDGLIVRPRIPNLLRIIDPAPLSEVDPDAVTLRY